MEAGYRSERDAAMTPVTYTVQLWSRCRQLSGAVEKPEGLEFADGFLAKGEAPEILLDKIVQMLAEKSHYNSWSPGWPRITEFTKPVWLKFAFVAGY